MLLTKDKKVISRGYTLKRPGLFAVRAILENARDGWDKYSYLVDSKPTSAYLSIDPLGGL